MAQNGAAESSASESSASESSASPTLADYERGLVVSAHPLASEAGVAMLQQGGNAVDAAVASTFAISVVEPFSAGIGGGGFLLLYEAAMGEVRSLDFRERAPQAATETMYLDESGEPQSRASLDGHQAVGVPGTVAGLYEVHQRYGNLPWQTVIEPALRLAEDGFAVHQRFVDAVDRRQEVLLANPAAREVFTREGTFYQVGERWRQPQLAQTLRRLAEEPRDFYEGEIAAAIAADMAAFGGLVTQEDLADYEPIWRDPLCGEFREFEVCAMGPPSSGGVHLLQILNLIGDRPLAVLGPDHPDTVHFLAEAMRIAYADRAEYLGDPDFVEVPVEALTSAAYAQYRRPQIDEERATPSEQVTAVDPSQLRNLQESPETSHLTVVDGDRNAVSLTFTVNGGFGAGVVAEGTGILLNNEMDDFAIAPGVANLYGLVGGQANAIAPGKTPLSSMTPTIVLQDNQLRMALGSPGGSTIITTVLQVLLNVLVYELDVAAAIAAPRFHHQWLPDRLILQEVGFAPETVETLRQRGHAIEQWQGWGNANAIVVRPDQTLAGAADPRGDGAALGW
ncbi:MAG: gamma-glutamyltranspeptidase Ggt [Phormidium sp. OSCR]|nr:MAG: gamma-glutamyltranspeptidase Ggt [Phormidium sp. OSCR]